jgi:hypothetical protein
MSERDWRYTLEIHEANSSEGDVLVTYESDHPFPALARGHVIRPLGRDGDKPLMVRHVEHIVWDSAGFPKVKTRVYTKSVPDHPHDWDDELAELTAHPRQAGRPIV